MVAKDEYASLDVYLYLKKITNLARNVVDRLPDPASVGDLIYTLNAYLFDEEGFNGTVGDPEDPRNSYLNCVLDQRRGSAVSLAIIYMTVGRCLGLPLQGLPFPGRFLVKLGSGDDELILDPFGGGIIVRDDLEALMLQQYGADSLPRSGIDGLVGAAEDEQVIVRLLENLKWSFMRQNQLEKALVVVHRIIRLTPSAAAFRERARILEKLQCHRAAAEDYRRYLELLPAANDSEEIRKRVNRLCKSAATVH